MKNLAQVKRSILHCNLTEVEKAAAIDALGQLEGQTKMINVLIDAIIQNSSAIGLETIRASMDEKLGTHQHS